VGIVVSGVGEATGSPDLAQVDLGVSVLGSTVAEASTTATTSAGSVIEALTRGGVAHDDIRTVEYSIRPEYEYSESQPRLVGYRVSNTMRAVLRDLTGIGPLLDSVSAAGGDNSRVDHLEFGVHDETALAAAAREAAWIDAMAKATQLADLAGQRLGRAMSITETAGAPPVPVRAMAEVARASTPIQPGTTAVTVTLQVEFELE
jgi:uncharacterized protein YggE